VTRGWADTKLGTVLELAYGKSLPKKSRKVGPYPVYGSNGVVSYHNEAAVQGPGIIVGRKGSCGEVHYCDCDFWPIDTTYYVALKDNTNLRFVAYLLSSMGLREMNSHSTIPGLNRERVYHLPVSLPPLLEQKKIAVVLLRIQRAIEIQEKIIQSVRDLKKSAMQHVFTRGLRGEKTKMTGFGPIPESWQIEPLGQCCTVQTGIAKGRKIADHETIELPYLRVANVQDGHLDLTEMKTIRLRAIEKERYSLQEGDIVLTEGGDFDKLGRGFVWEDQIPDCVHQNHVFAVRPDKSRLLPHYLAYLVQSLYGKAYFLKVAHKTTNLACINTNKLKGFPVAIPDTREQEDLVHCIGTIDAKVGFHESKTSALQDLFKTTLNKLMTGGIRVGDLDIDISEVEA
jgi:type I restriction enzyme S subunit